MAGRVREDQSGAMGSPRRGREADVNYASGTHVDNCTRTGVDLGESAGLDAGDSKAGDRERSWAQVYEVDGVKSARDVHVLVAEIHRVRTEQGTGLRRYPGRDRRRCPRDTGLR